MNYYFIIYFHWGDNLFPFSAAESREQPARRKKIGDSSANPFDMSTEGSMDGSMGM